jgi:DNA-binding IclR family transcriptional regulator
MKKIGDKSSILSPITGISDAKTISKAIGLKPSRTRDYLKQLMDEGILEVAEEYKSRKYRIKK